MAKDDPLPDPEDVDWSDVDIEYRDMDDELVTTTTRID